MFVDGKLAPHVARRGYALTTEDDLGKVLRVHLLIERALDITIKQSVPNPKFLPRLRSFSDRVKLALALGLDPQMQGALTSINSLRNDFAHEGVKEEVTEQDFAHLLSTIPLSWRETVELMHQVMVEAAVGLELDGEQFKPLSEMRPGTRWATYALAILSGIEFAEIASKLSPDQPHQDVP